MEAYKWQEPNGRWMGVGWTGNAKKPSFYYQFRNEGRIQEEVDILIQQRQRHKEYKDKKQEERRNYKHDLVEGDILSGSWGYDQTNVSWYQVVNAGEKSVKIREIASKMASNDRVVPLPGKFVGPAMNKRVSTGGYVKIKSYLSVSKWDGRPKYETPVGYGH